MPPVRRPTPLHSTDPSAIATARRMGNPDPRTHRRLHELAEHAIAREDITDIVGILNEVPDRESVETRVEVIKRVPIWQEKLINSRRLGRMVLPRYRESFSLMEYAYGSDARYRDQRRYVIQRVLSGYVIPSPLKSAPRSESIMGLRVMGRHQDLVIATDEDSSWIGTVHAYRNPLQAATYEPAVGVGHDIDVLGLGRSSNRAIDAIAGTEPGSMIPRKIDLLIYIAEKLLDLHRAAEE
jgi:hypothetical protein